MIFHSVVCYETDSQDMLGIESTLYLQRYAEGWTDGKWETRADFRPCNDKTNFAQVSFNIMVAIERMNRKLTIWLFLETIMDFSVCFVVVCVG